MMNNRDEDILYKDLEIPEIVWEKANVVFSQINMEEEKHKDADKKGGMWKISRLRKAAAAAIICCFIFGSTAAAMEIISVYRQRMENMEKEKIEDFYQLAHAGESNSLNRPFTAEEESLSDEDLLEIIDFNHKMTYSIYEKNEERILAQGDWESRMAAMTDAEVDRIYLAYCASNLDVGGGYSRELGQTESERYEELKERYENEGVYSELELTIIKTADEYTGIGVAFCEENSKYYFPDGELSDSELLQIIDFDHKITYCFDRISYDIQMGFREGYPKPE